MIGFVPLWLQDFVFFFWSSIAWLVFILLRSFGYRGLGFFLFVVFGAFVPFKSKDFMVFVFRFRLGFVPSALILMIEILLVYNNTLFGVCLFLLFLFFWPYAPAPRPCDSRDRFSGRYTMYHIRHKHCIIEGQYRFTIGVFLADLAGQIGCAGTKKIRYRQYCCNRFLPALQNTKLG